MKQANLLKYELTRSLASLVPSMKVAKTQNAPPRQLALADVLMDVVTPTGRRRRLYLMVQEQPVPSRVREGLRQLRALTGRPREIGGAAISRGRHAASYPVLASRFVSPRVRQICQEEGVGYVDLAGNCLLRWDDCYVEKSVERNPFPARGRPASLFAPISSRLVRAVLEEPGRAWQVSELARVTGVSLGQSSHVVRRLVEEGYAELSARRVHLRQPAQLLEAWGHDYALVQQARFAYYSFEQDPARLMARLPEAAQAITQRYAVTSFAGAWLVAPFVHGVSTVHWYIEADTELPRWVEALDLRPVDAGPNVVLVVPRDAGVFYRARAVNEVMVVGNVQLYLDLVNDPARGREQAEFLRKEQLKF